METPGDTEIKAMSGTLKVKSFPKFANQVSTIDIKNGIAEYKKSMAYLQMLLS